MPGYNLGKFSLEKDRYYRKRGDPRPSFKDDTGCCLLQLGGFRYEYLKVFESIWTEFVLERIILMQSFYIQSLYPWTKLTLRNERHLIIKLCTCILTLFFTLPGLDFFLKLPNAFHFVERGIQQWTIEYQVLSYRYWPSVNKQHPV